MESPNVTNPIWMGLLCDGEEVFYPGYRRRRMFPTSVSLSPDGKNIVIVVEADFQKVPADWGLLEAFFLSESEEGGDRIYKDFLAYPIEKVPKGRSFILNTTFTSPIPKQHESSKRI